MSDDTEKTEYIILSISEHFEATNEFRWRHIREPNLVACILEQKWQGKQGTIRWEEVPHVDAEGMPLPKPPTP